MNTFFKIKMVARYESKTLLRSWFFRIFAALALIFIIFFNLAGFGILGGNGIPGRLTPGALPYMSMFFLNIAQAIIAIFLSADFLGRDKKLDTTEAFYIRDISNFAYVAGKTLGILKVFFILNLLVLLIGGVITTISSEVSFNVFLFVIYPLLISVPTLLFVLGLSFFTMLLVRNQAITFVLLLGYIAVVLFYLNVKLYGVWDFLSFFTPLAYSDLSGFFELKSVLFLRGAYLTAGFLLISATITMLPRLSQGKQFRLKSYVINVVLLVVSATLFTLYLTERVTQENHLNKVRELNKTLAESSYKIESYDIDLNHTDNKITCKTVLNISQKPGSTEDGNLVLALNPGLKISSLEVDGKPVDYTREMHLVTIPKSSLGSTQPVEIEMDYTGTIDNSVLFPDIPDESLNAPNRSNIIISGKQYSFVSPNYVLLTRESNWYPFVASTNYWARYLFSTFNLKVKTDEALTAISQGESEEPIPGEYLFTPETKLNAMSLTIGNYVVKESVIDSVQMRVFYHPDHTVYLSVFDSIQDTIPYLLKEIKGDYERKLGINYPFKRISVVESPIHFFSFLRSFSLATENIMPEIVFFPENGGGDWRNDLGIQYRMIERMGRRADEELSEKDKKARLFKRFVGDNFVQPSSFFMGIRIAGGRQIEGWGKYQLFPMFFAYRDFIDQKGFPVMNISMENYLFNRQKAPTRGPSSGLNANDRVILALKDNSLKELIDKKDESEYSDIVAAKGTQLFGTLKASWKSVDFDTFIDSLLEANAFKDYSLNMFVDDLSQRSGQDFNTVLDNWMNEKKVAAFIFGKIDVFKIKDGERDRHFIRLPVSNSGEVDGIIEFQVMEGSRGGMRGRFRSGGMTEDNKINYLIKAGEKVEIGFLTDQEPRVILTNTFLAKNIPSSGRLFDFNVVKKEGFTDFFEGVRPTDKKVSFSNPYEIIVDNEDEGCEIVNSSEASSIKDWWVNRQNIAEADMEYKSVRFWNPPVKWELAAGSNFYGEYIKSTYYKRNGDGNAKIRWTAKIKDSGEYECYVYVPQHTRMYRFRRQKKTDDKFLYTVHHDDGDEEITITVSETDSGWILLGDFYFSEGDASIELSDKSEASLIFGDAVKWVKR